MVRIFNTYGPRLQMNDGRVISNFLTQALSGQDLTIYGDGSQTRSFCYVSDQVEGILLLSRSEEHTPVNIGNPEEFTMLECAEEILRATGSASKITYRPLPTDDPKQRKPDITKAKAILGWTPKVNLREGLGLTLPWFAERIEKGSAENPDVRIELRLREFFQQHLGLCSQRGRTIEIVNGESLFRLLQVDANLRGRFLFAGVQGSLDVIQALSVLLIRSDVSCRFCEPAPPSPLES